MVRISLINQPFGGHPNRIGDHIISLLDRSTDKFVTINMVVAFAKMSGVGILYNYLQDFVKGGGSLNIVVGIDQMGTSKQCLDLLLQTGAKIYLFHNPGGGTFHPKFYLFQRPGIEGVVIAGSNNLTRGGLFDNFEFSIRLDFDLSDDSETVEFQSFWDCFDMIIDPNTGMAKTLGRILLEKLDHTGLLFDESREASMRPLPPNAGEYSIFSHFPVPHGPRTSSRINIPAKPSQPGASVALFLMTLGLRDTRQQKGFSRDIFIPIKARNANSSFWNWDIAFVNASKNAKGTFRERRVDLQITPTDGVTRLIRQVRIYYYAERDEFRINCSELITGASEGDIMLISAVQAGVGFDYDAMIISQTSPMYKIYINLCSNSIPNSKKRWGYA